MKIDITTGDVITPREIIYHFPLTFENRCVAVWAYTLETILAEKYETVIRRGTGNTRARDFYDLYLLHKLYAEKINKTDLQRAVALTLWGNYREENLYAKDIDFETVIESAREIEKMLQ